MNYAQNKGVLVLKKSGSLAAGRLFLKK